MDKKDRYWEKNIRLVTGLLSLWASVSFGCGILLHNKLDIINLPGTHFPLGFWFAQQGSIYTFVCLIFFYSWRMNKIDKKFIQNKSGS